jgi:hypothetical protein
MLQFLGSPEYILEHAQRSEIVVTRTESVAVVSSRWQGHGTYQGKRECSGSVGDVPVTSTSRSWCDAAA